MKHELPPLPYAKNALEPVMSAETLEYHYGKHHKGYLDKLNQLIPGTEFETLPLEEIIRRAGPGPVFNNAAQVWNHTFFWNSLSPNRPTLSGDLLALVGRHFGSVDEFRRKFEAAGVGLFGSGYVWLVREASGKLAIKTTQNAENPLKTQDVALLTCDVWEHAYYLDYRNERNRFLGSVWDFLNWDFAASNLELALGQRAA